MPDSSCPLVWSGRRLAELIAPSSREKSPARSIRAMSFVAAPEMAALTRLTEEESRHRCWSQVFPVGAGRNLHEWRPTGKTVLTVPPEAQHGI